MDKHICSICQKEVTENAHFWKEHRVKEADYFQKYFPRYSKQTGELITFKNRDSYLLNDFNGKKEMSAWFKENPEEAKSYGLGLLAHRISQKKLSYAPSQVELRSLMMPSMVWYKKQFETYAKACEMIGGPLPKFDKEDDIIGFGELSPHDKIIIDTREQKALQFDIPTEIQTLKYGDYALSPNKFKVHIERKNLPDFVGTLGMGFDRFCREIERAKKDRAYLIVLVESNINDALSFNYLPQTRYCKVGPDFVFHNVREIMQKYSNVQFLFVNGRKEATEYVKKIFSIKKHPKHFDLEYFYETKQL